MVFWLASFGGWAERGTFAIDAAAVATIAALMQRLVGEGTVFDALWLFGFNQGCSGVNIEDEGSRGPTLFTVK